MKGRKPTNSDLDLLAARILKAGRKSPVEIDKIVSAPTLFDGVLQKIANTPLKASTGWFRLNRRASLAVSAILIAVSATLIGFLRSGSDIVVSETGPARIVLPFPEPEAEILSPINAAMPALAEKRQSIRASGSDRSRRPEPKTAFAADPPPIEAEFHAIGLSNTAQDAILDGRVVRVELPRSALFAMGIDIPLENGTRSVQADLLVGADGSPRAIRLVE